MHTTAKLIRIVVVTAVVVAAGALVLWKITENKPLLPDRAPVDVEENAVINNEAEEKMDTPRQRRDRLRSRHPAQGRR